MSPVDGQRSGQDRADDVDGALRATPRRAFLPPERRRAADLDRPIPIGAGQTCSQPSTVRRMLELLDVRAGQQVLDVGSGSGWTTALLAWLVGPSGTVVAVELEPRLAVAGRAALEATGRAWARIELATPGRLGWPDEQPYDRLLVSAEAAVLPEELVAQLAEGGVMVLPVAGHLLRVHVLAGGRQVEELGRYRFVPLR